MLGVELTLPVENAGAGGGGFRLGDAAEFLQEYGEARVGEDVVGEGGEVGVGEREGVVEAAGVFEGAEQRVGGGLVGGVERERVLEVGDGGFGIAGRHVVEGGVERGVGGCGGGHGVSIEGGAGAKDEQGLTRMSADQESDDGGVPRFFAALQNDIQEGEGIWRK